MPRKYQDNLRLTGKQRARNVSFIAWPDSMNIERLDSDIERTLITAARSPLHDRDVYDKNDVEKWLHRHGFTDFDLDWSEDELHEYQRMCDGAPWIGDLKKSHYHYIIISESNHGLAELNDWTGGQVTYFEKVASKKQSLRYLIHKGWNEKYQYSFDDIKAFGGIDLSPILSQTEIEVIDYFTMVRSHILKERVSNMWTLSEWAEKQGDIQIEKCIKQNWGYYSRLMGDGNTLRANARKALGPAPDALREFEGDMFKSDGFGSPNFSTSDR